MQGHKKGISLRIAALPKLIEALQKAESEARLRGLLGTEPNGGGP